MPTTLKERLQEVMGAMEWEYADLVAAAGESHSVVSQWLGRGSKIIKTIGKLEAAERIEAATGYSALWVAKGMGPKRRTRIGAGTGGAVASGHEVAVTAAEPVAGYASPAQMGVRLAAEFAMLPETFGAGREVTRRVCVSSRTTPAPAWHAVRNVSGTESLTRPTHQEPPT